MKERMIELSNGLIPESSLRELDAARLVREHRQAAQRYGRSLCGGDVNDNARDAEMDLGYEILRRLDPEAYILEVAKDHRAHRPDGDAWLAQVLARLSN